MYKGKYPLKVIPSRRPGFESRPGQELSLVDRSCISLMCYAASTRCFIFFSLKQDETSSSPAGPAESPGIFQLIEQLETAVDKVLERQVKQQVFSPGHPPPRRRGTCRYRPSIQYV
jgi:hypothetical protein